MYKLKYMQIKVYANKQICKQKIKVKGFLMH